MPQFIHFASVVKKASTKWRDIWCEVEGLAMYLSTGLGDFTSELTPVYHGLKYEQPLTHRQCAMIRTEAPTWSS